ncbi:glycosyltransferase family 4 protein [Flavobacteriaceae bacterium KMM 6898]|nr:glycosyltransferase family 4 protein [Flavobacteriaceae bacterium KMM 6898]
MKIKKDVLVFGNFASISTVLCGQTVKTRNIYNLLKSKESTHFKSVNYFDTDSIQEKKTSLLKGLKEVMKADILYYLPAKNSLTYIFPIIYILAKISTTQIHFVVVGGWIDRYIRNMFLHIYMLKRVKKIYPETNNLCDALKKKYGYKNVVQLNNYRIHELSTTPTVTSNPIKLVFMARINPKKGIETLFRLSRQLEKLKIENVVIDMYGPILPDYELKFKSDLKNTPLNITYKGALKPNEIYAVLAKYDIMLFPTQYYTEGFPGSILDAYIAGIPVIATDWQYASEFILQNKSGIIVEFDNSEIFISTVIETVQNISLIDSLKHGAGEMAQKYSATEAWEVLHQNLEN